MIYGIDYKRFNALSRDFCFAPDARFRGLMSLG